MGVGVTLGDGDGAVELLSMVFRPLPCIGMLAFTASALTIKAVHAIITYSIRFLIVYSSREYKSRNKRIF